MKFPDIYGIRNTIKSWSKDPEDDKEYNVFHRTWWRRDNQNRLEPRAGKNITLQEEY